MVSFLT